MINNVSNSQVTFGSHRHPLHQVNRLSKALSGKLAFAVSIGTEIAAVGLEKTQIKGSKKQTIGISENVAGAAENLLRRLEINEGVTLVVNGGTPLQAEYFAKKGRQGIEVKRLA